jgi:signal peptidase II
MVAGPALQATQATGGVRSRSSLPYVWLSLLIVILDQLTKAWVVRKIAMFQTVNVLPVLQITHVYNRGAAFSFLNDSSGWQRWAFAALALIVSALIIGWLRRIDRREMVLASGAALVLGGAIGNLIDRLRLGHVIDFVAAHWGPHYFPIFNLADSAITVGVILWLLDGWLEGRHKAR